MEIWWVDFVILRLELAGIKTSTFPWCILFGILCLDVSHSWLWIRSKLTRPGPSSFEVFETCPELPRYSSNNFLPSKRYVILAATTKPFYSLNKRNKLQKTPPHVLWNTMKQDVRIVLGRRESRGVCVPPRPCSPKLKLVPSIVISWQIPILEPLSFPTQAWDVCLSLPPLLFMGFVPSYVSWAAVKLRGIRSDPSLLSEGGVFFNRNIE